AGLNGLNPSGIEHDPQTGNYLIVAAKQRAIIEITPEGKLVATAKLAKRWHRQSEGIAIMPDRSLVIGDEGTKKTGGGSLTFYASRSSR
ncbi:MAG: SdiA-regulated domain-containing protein, partial [Anaerolineae bacterium]|nr:SdiA-regulated domain-containing protein [Gemmatimonadaceae bacterium]